MAAKRTKVRTLRHWKQRFDKNAAFVFRRRIIYDGKQYKPGDAIPKVLQSNPTKLRRFWESKTIELALFEAPDVATGKKGKKQAAGGKNGNGGNKAPAKVAKPATPPAAPPAAPTAAQPPAPPAAPADAPPLPPEN